MGVPLSIEVLLFEILGELNEFYYDGSELSYFVNDLSKMPSLIFYLFISIPLGVCIVC